jgi:PAS domain S-box-containing protein
MPDAYALLDALFSHAPMGLAFWDADLRYRRINPALAEINGVAPEDHLGRTATDVLGPDLGGRVEEMLRRVQETAQPFVDADITGVTPASPGEQRQWLASYYPVPARDGEMLGGAPRRRRPRCSMRSSAPPRSAWRSGTSTTATAASTRRSPR